MDYPIYTTAYDEVVRPLDLNTAEELEELSSFFHTMCPVKDFEPLRERLEQLKAPDEPTMVTLLVDNSGSMRGSPITFALGTVGIIGMYLDRLGIPNEILGFTTKTWKGGKPYEDFRKAGYPERPGRLAALRHIVYKQVDEQLADVRNNLALMLREGVLKENIDGEAVQWACERLRSHDVKRRILLIISDGAPVDSCTLDHNCYPEYQTEELADGTLCYNILSLHLHYVVNELDKAGDIRLDAIGIGHDVSSYYGVGDKISLLEDLAPTAIRKLEELLR